MRYHFRVTRVVACMQSVDAGGLAIGGSAPPRIMGVLNVSEESPYDPSVFTDPSAAAEYVDTALIEEGADIVDIGLESANKRYEVLPPEEELERLDTAIETIDSVSSDAVFSIETRYATVAEAALDGGFDMVNDICGFADPDMPAVATDYDVPVVKMAGPGDLQRPGALDTVDAIYDALASDPLPRNTIVDPAFGGWSASKTETVDRETFRRLREFRALDRPMLVSINRKNFLRHLADRSTEEALPVSLAATSMAVERGANVIRTHDVAGTRDAARIGDEFAVNGQVDPELGMREIVVCSSAELKRHLARVGGPQTAAVDGSTLVFELTGLTTMETSLLQHLVADCGGRFVQGETDRDMLLANERELRELRSAVGDESERLAAALEQMVDGSA